MLPRNCKISTLLIRWWHGEDGRWKQQPGARWRRRAADETKPGSTIITQEGVQGSDIIQRGYKKPMISQCSSYATADDYWTARIDNRKIMMLPLRYRCWYDRRNLTSYCKNAWGFYFAKNKNSLAPRWHDKFLPEPYACWHLWKPYIYAACFALSFVKLFATLVRFVSCF